MVRYHDLHTGQSALRDQLIQERGRKCEYCGNTQGVFDADHACLPKCTYRKKMKALDEPYNLILLCRECHARKDSGYRQWAWETNAARYGRDVMQEWKNSLDLKVKWM